MPRAGADTETPPTVQEEDEEEHGGRHHVEDGGRHDEHGIGTKTLSSKKCRYGSVITL